MEFMFDVLGHSAALPLNLDREGFTTDNIRNYTIEVADAEAQERNMQWLLIHLFYLTLKYVPGLFKAWFRDCRSKQTKIAVEAWMTKHFSPLVIYESLEEVKDWASKQEPPEQDEKELLVKVSKGANEVTVGYEVDELQASIAIRVPNAYPLQPVTVAGLNRVAVSEKKWQSWLLVTQGVITFSVSPSFMSNQTRPSTDNRGTAEWQHHRRDHRVPPERRRRPQGPDRVRHLLLHHLHGQEDAGQEVQHVQEHLPPHLPVQVVPGQQPEHVPALQEPDRLPRGGERVSEGYRAGRRRGCVCS